MLISTPKRNEDLRHIDTGLPADERTAARLEGLRQKALVALGTRWVLAREHAPKRGNYNNHGIRIA